MGCLEWARCALSIYRKYDELCELWQKLETKKDKIFVHKLYLTIRLITFAQSFYFAKNLESLEFSQKAFLMREGKMDFLAKKMRFTNILNIWKLRIYNTWIMFSIKHLLPVFIKNEYTINNINLMYTFYINMNILNRYIILIHLIM